MPSRVSTRLSIITTGLFEQPGLSLQNPCQIRPEVQATLNGTQMPSTIDFRTMIDDLSQGTFGMEYTPIIHRMPSPTFSDDEDLYDFDSDDESGSEAETDSSLEDDPINEKSHLEEILDGLYVAYADDEDEIAELRTFHYRKFSHILHVVPVPCVFTEPIPGRVDQPAGTVNEEIAQSRRQTRTLSLSVPEIPNVSQTQTLLNPSQLLAARDFIALAMPYMNSYLPYIPRWCCSVDVLIVAPVGRKADILSVLACYLAFTSGNFAGTVLECMREAGEYDPEWDGGDGAVAPNVVKLVEEIARTW